MRAGLKGRPEEAGDGKITSAAVATPVSGFEIIFRPDPNIYDGRYANVGWLQELPKPVTNLAWDNAALVSGATLTKLGLAEQDIVEITVGSYKVKAPVLVAPGHPDNSATIHLGYGRESCWPCGFGCGLQCLREFRLPMLLLLRRARSRRWMESGDWPLPRATTRITARLGLARKGTGNNSLEGNEAETRGIIRSATLEEFKRIRVSRTKAKSIRRMSTTRLCSELGLQPRQCLGYVDRSE